MENSSLGQWLRRRFIAGFFLTVPLVLSIAALVWIFGIIDGFTAPLATRLVGLAAPGLVGRAAPGVGLALMLLFVLAVGTVATNVIGFFPLLWTRGPGDDLLASIAAPLVGGMLSSAVHVLYITPLLFYLVKKRALKKLN